ncbi:MAG TPA: hypothetical protein VFK32_00885 [Tepidiformaceae bacterium]|nr:hypothetical protein [Tepidiformaceae bacterium]
MPAPSRPELAFEVYLDLGPDRSLARLVPTSKVSLVPRARTPGRTEA